MLSCSDGVCHLTADFSGALYLVPTEDIILLAARAFGTAEATDQQDRDPDGHDQSQKASARYEPMYQAMHNHHIHKRPISLMQDSWSSDVFYPFAGI